MRRQCPVCEEFACEFCSDRWYYICDKEDKEEHTGRDRVCNDCHEVRVTTREVFDELLRRHRAVHKTQDTFKSIKAYLREGRVSAYQKWKKDQGVKTESDSDADEADPVTEKTQETPNAAEDRLEEQGSACGKRRAGNDETCDAKRACASEKIQ